MKIPSPRWLAASAAVVLAAASGIASDHATARFDGKFDAWEHVLADAAVKRDSVWTFRDDILVCTGAPVGVLYTKKEFTNFKLVVEYRWAPGQKPGNSGIMSRLQAGTGALPLTCEVQLQHGNAGDLIGLKGFTIANGGQARWFERESPVAGKVTGVRRATGAEAAPGEWNHVEIEARDGHYVVRMNGTVVNDVTGVAVQPGRIGLQSEGGEIHFRAFQVTEI